MKNVFTASPASSNGRPRIALECPAITHVASKNRSKPIDQRSFASVTAPPLPIPASVTILGYTRAIIS